MADRWWHYTVGDKLVRIMGDGCIKRPMVGLCPGERPAVWFTRHQHWEPMATPVRYEAGRLRPVTFEEMLREFSPIVRVEVGLAWARHTWAEHRQRLGRMDSRIADQLEIAARERGSNPDDWRLSYQDVPLWEAVSVETWREGVWVPAGTLSLTGLELVSSWFAEALQRAARCDVRRG